jgi:putative transposase
MQPSHVLRREFEYIRHGTLSWFINFDVVSGQIIAPSWGPTRTEEDALTHIQRLIASDAKATKWHIILDNLNIHQSESLVCWVAEREGIAREALGVKGKSGILQSMESRATFLHDPLHQVVLYDTPKHASWMKKARNLAEYSGTQAAQAGQFHLAGQPARSDLGFHCLLQPHDGQTHQVDVHRAELT